MISKEEFVSYRQDYTKKEEQLKKQLLCLSKEVKRKVDNVSESAWVQHLRTYREAERLDRATAVEMLHEIKVYENRTIKITYNFSGELSALFAGTL